MTALVAAILIFLLAAPRRSAPDARPALPRSSASRARLSEAFSDRSGRALLAGGPDLPRRVLGESPAFIVALGLDALSAFFLVPVFVLGAAAALYGAGYMRAYGEKRSLGPAWFAFNALMAGMTARRPRARRGPVPRRVGGDVARRVGARQLRARTVEVRRAGGSTSSPPTSASPSCSDCSSSSSRGGASLDRLVLRRVRPPRRPLRPPSPGSASRPGFIPLHVWLPEAHAAAPSHVSPCSPAS